MGRFKEPILVIGILLLMVGVAVVLANFNASEPAAVSAGREPMTEQVARGASAEASGKEVVVELEGLQFNPRQLQVEPGTTVVFVNSDPVEHNVIQATVESLGDGQELFRSPQLQPGEEWRYTFQDEGVYAILCDVAGHHLAGMTGQIVVGSETQEGAAATDAPRVAKSPTDIPAPIDRTEPETVVLELETVELEGKLADGLTYTYWTFDETVPGPMLRVRQGDTVELRLRNREDSTQIHSIDLHAVTGPGGGAGVTQVAPGEEKTFRFKARHPGVYVYHCATPYIPAHVANGMYGMIVVEPEEGFAPVDKEFYVMQGEFYTDARPGYHGHANYDDEALWDEQPNFVVFNGQFQGLTGEHAMKAEVGDRIRMFVGNAGPNLVSSFHIIGEVFDVLHPEAATEPVSNVQTTVIGAGGAAWVEFEVEVPGEYVLVDHALNRALGKGALAVLDVAGPDNPDIFQPLND